MDFNKFKEMTKKTGMEILKIVGSTIGSAILAVTMMAWSINRENDKKLEEKANITYVDQKCLQIKTDLNRESDIRFEAIDKKLDLIIELSNRNNQK